MVFTFFWLLFLRVIFVKFICVAHVAVIHFHCCRELHYIHGPQFIKFYFYSWYSIMFSIKRRTHCLCLHKDKRKFWGRVGYEFFHLTVEIPLISVMIGILGEIVKYCFLWRKKLDYTLNIGNSCVRPWGWKELMFWRNLFANLLKLKIYSFCFVLWKNPNCEAVLSWNLKNCFDWQ